MALYKENIVDIDLAKGNIHRTFLAHSIGTADIAADRFGIRVFRGVEDVDLTGCSCYGYFRDPQGNNIALTSHGTVDGNLAYVTLPQACYNYEGQFCLAIKLIGGGVTGTMRIVDGVVDNTNTGSAVAPTGTVPTYSEIISQYDAMVAATAAANGCIAETFDATKAYPAGKYVINSGALYRLLEDHAASTTWANTIKVEVKFGNELSDVKIAMNEIAVENTTLSMADYPVINCTINASNKANVTASRYQSVQIPTFQRIDILEVTANGSKDAVICFLKSFISGNPANNTDLSSYLATGETGRHMITAGETDRITVPTGTAYIMISIKSNNDNVVPSSVIAHNRLYSIINNATIASIASVDGGDMVNFMTINGAVKKADGNDFNSIAIQGIYYRTPYVFARKNEEFILKGLYAITTVAVVAVYNMQMEYDSTKSLAGYGESTKRNGKFVMPYDGYVRFSSKQATIDETSIYKNLSNKRLSILVIGNSFSQDSFAYLPPVLNELLPDYEITYGVAYKASAGIQDHVDMYEDTVAANKLYTWFDYWKPNATMWTRYAKGGDPENGKTLEDILDYAPWDIIYVQPNGQLDDIVTNVVYPGRRFIRMLNDAVDHPFTVMMGQWLTDNQYVPDMKTALETVKNSLGINHIIPIGTGIANARSNSTLNQLGESTTYDPPKMLYDHTHQQSGLPALISTYVIANYLLKILGVGDKSVYNSTFFPTTENCIAINAYKEGGMVTPLPMTHGESVGVTTDNVRAAQEIAAMAVNNPFVVTDCSNILNLNPDS